METKPLVVSGLTKSFTMHLRDGVVIPVLSDLSFVLERGGCTILAGPSGIGKSSILKMIYGNYLINDGQVLVWHEGAYIDLATALPRMVLKIRQTTIGYVSQFLRAVPRVSALDVAADPLIAAGGNHEEALEKAKALFSRLNLPEKLWHLPPATFSGGEQQRVNIARGFLTDHPVLLLDEPTASLDATNRKVVIELIEEKKAKGTAILGIFHDADVRQAIGTASVDVTQFAGAKAA